MGWSGAYFGADSIEERSVALLGMELGSSTVPTLVAGRMIQTPTEIVLGSTTAHMLGKKVGDSVRVGVGTDLTTLRVVGTATFPTIGIAHGAHTSLGVGALVVPDLVPGFDRASNGSGNGSPGAAASSPGPPVIFVRFAPDAHLADARRLVAQAVQTIGEEPGFSAAVLGPQRSAEIVNSSEIRGVPTKLALVLGAATAISLAVSLSASVRRRRRELALLQALGFTRYQLSTSVMWQATGTIMVGLAFGVPTGLALGRVLWTSFSDRLDVLPRSSTPIGVVLLLSGASIVVAGIAAVIPARRASRTRPAHELRSA